jgi:hypothetical protein
MSASVDVTERNMKELREQLSGLEEALCRARDELQSSRDQYTKAQAEQEASKKKVWRGGVYAGGGEKKGEKDGRMEEGVAVPAIVLNVLNLQQYKVCQFDGFVSYIPLTY